MNTTTSLLATLLTGLVLPLGASANCNFAGVDAALTNLVNADGLNGGAVLIGSTKGILHEYYYGTYTTPNNQTASYGPDTIIPIASSTKLLSGVRMLQLADAGLVNFDTPVSQYLAPPTFAWSTDASNITLRQMFSHTAGYGNDENDTVLNPTLDGTPLTLSGSVQDIADNYESLSPQRYLPAGSLFAYGGVAMQIGGEVAQMQTRGNPSPLGGTETGNWQADWQHDLSAPLCIQSIDWQGLGPTLNYRISGGAQTTLRDYARVLAMLLNGGIGNGTRLLSPAAMQTFMTSQTGSAPPGCTDGCVPTAEMFQKPGGGLYANTQYSVGAWIEPQAADGGTSEPGAPVVSSIGKFGFAPWIDYASGTFGIIMVLDTTHASETGQNAASVTSHAAMQQIITDALLGVRAQVPAGGMCPAMTEYDVLFSGAFEATPAAPVCPGTVTLP